MEEAVGAGRDSLVAIHSTGADDADWRFVTLHIVRLVARGVAAQQDVLGHVVRMLLQEESVLHVAGRVVGGKVEHGKHVLVVVHLGTVGEGEAHTREDVDDFVLDDSQRVARQGRWGREYR